jgi:septal ring factor EnvC (AmiA/AmiB activator)
MTPGPVFEGKKARTQPGSVFAPIALAAVLLVTAIAQVPPRPDAQRRLDERIRALQKESEDLARQSQTLAGELRKLEIERDLRGQEAKQAEADAASAEQMLAATTARLAVLEEQRTAQLPDLKRQLVDLYKRGRGRYLQLLFRANGVRDFARATRAVAALTTINERRIAEHRRTTESLATERATLERTSAVLRDRERASRDARAAAERAVAARAELLARIDARRDLTAQYAGELQVTFDRLQQQLASNGSRGAPAAGVVAVPLAPFRGALDWPVTGKITGRFGAGSGRLGGNALRNGIEIAAPEDTPVRAVHPGTVGYAEVFTGFGNLVIVDHGANNYSLYGHLRTISVPQGAAVEAGTELGRVGPAPAGPPALYFEMRIDGRSVDPLQWLRLR